MKRDMLFLIAIASCLSHDPKYKRRVEELDEKIDDAMWDELLSPKGNAG